MDEDEDMEDDDDDSSENNMALSSCRPNEKEKHLSLPFRKLAPSPVRAAAPWSGIKQSKRAASPLSRTCKASEQSRWQFNINGGHVAESDVKKSERSSDQKEGLQSQASKKVSHYFQSALQPGTSSTFKLKT